MAEKQEESMNKDEQIGFHKGALSTLSKEREEMAKILGICEQLMQMHVKALQELGVDLVAQAKEAAKNNPQQPASKTPPGAKIDDLL